MPTSRVELRWQGRGLEFEGGAPDKPRTVVDGDSKTAPSPVDTMLLGLAGCLGSDLVYILEKSRVEFVGLQVDVIGQRVEEHPRRLEGLRLVFTVSGVDPSDDAKVKRAVDLSRDTYCSVLHSLRTDLEIEIEIVRA